MHTIHQRATRTVITALFVPLILVALLPQSALAEPPIHARAVKTDATFNAWADKFAEGWVRLDPERATATQYFSGAEQNALDRQLTPLTEAQRARTRALARAGVHKLDKYLADPLDENQRISAGTMRWSLAKSIEGEQFEDHRFVFAQTTGVHIGLVSFLTQLHPMRNAADVDNYLARLDQVAVRIDEALARGRSAAQRKLLPPRVILERAQDQVNSFLKAPAPENVFVSSLAKRSESLAGLSPEARADAIARATRIVNDKIIPAYSRVKDFMADIHPRTRAVVGLSNLPDGVAAYRYALSNFTGTTLTAEQIHAIGLREVARIEGEMDKHLRALGYTDGPVKDRLAKLDATLQPAGTADPRPELLARYAQYVRDGEARSGTLFNLKPRAPIEVRREPPLTEKAASAHYTLPAPDGSRPGVFWVPLLGPTYEIVRMRGTAYHEAVPGHHFQLAIQQEQASLPKFRASRIFGGGSAHSEGWGLYAERLALDNGWYDGDMPGLLGALDLQLFRARRLVVDTGMHAKGWTREQAIDYGLSSQEVERYISVPGQATAYMIGMLRILELREKAMTGLGPKFSLPAFHDVVLRSGSVPLDVLTEVIDRWIAQQKKT